MYIINNYYPLPLYSCCKKPNRRPSKDACYIFSKTNSTGDLYDLSGDATCLVLLITILHRHQRFSTVSYIVQTCLTYSNLDLCHLIGNDQLLLSINLCFLILASSFHAVEICTLKRMLALFITECVGHTYIFQCKGV